MMRPVSHALNIDQLEALALSEDRDAALQQLIPGTNDHYLYKCVFLQNDGEYEKVEALVRTWSKAHGENSEVQSVLRRQAILRYDDQPKASAKYIKRALDLSFNYARRIEGETPQLPSRLDEAQIDRDRLYKQVCRDYPRSLKGFTKIATEWLLGLSLPEHYRRNILERVQRPDHDKLLGLIIEDLNRKKSGGFGSQPIHSALLEAQLDALAKKVPDLTRNSNFVMAKVAKLQPGPDTDWRHQAQEKRDYLDRLWGYVQGLAPIFNSLKAHVLYHRLDFDRSCGYFDRETFMTYLAVPKHSTYVKSKFLEGLPKSSHIAQLHSDYRATTLLGPAGDDEALVLNYLSHFFEQDEGYEVYSPYIQTGYLKRHFALTKIARGLGDRETWYAMFDDPSAYKRFEQEVELEFTADNPRTFKAHETVRIHLDVKNVDDLVVKVYEINTLNYFLQNGSEVDTSVDLDGLVARQETTHTYTETAARRVRRSFDFEALKAPGTYVVEFIGKGRSSRALIRKGTLNFVERIGASGHVFSVVDDANELLADASIWFAGQEYTADAKGQVHIPFTANPGTRQILIRHGELTSLETFAHRAESYTLKAGVFVEREQLKAGAEAEVLIRTALYLHEQPVSLKLLQHPTLVIDSTDRDGVSSTMEVRDLELEGCSEFRHRFKVPDNLKTLSIRLHAKVKTIAGTDVDVQDSWQDTFNGIDSTDYTQSLVLSRSPQNNVLLLLGKTGEVRPHQPVTIRLRHEFFSEEVEVTLQTDARGRIDLGELEQITDISAQTQDGQPPYQWSLRNDGGRYGTVMHLMEGETARIPHVGPPIKRGLVKRLMNTSLTELVSLLERRGDSYQEDWAKNVKLESGYFVISGLPAGDYHFLDRVSMQTMSLKITRGKARAGWAMGPARMLQRNKIEILNITNIDVDDRTIKVQLGGSSVDTRVHVIGTRYYPSRSMGQALSRISGRGLGNVAPSPIVSDYISGRDIGDEYRYILERKSHPKYPGNMLDRPGLLLNPWAVQKTDTTIDNASAGGAFAACEAPAPRRSGHGGGGGGGSAGTQNFANLGFLKAPQQLLSNLRATDGRIELSREQLGASTTVLIVAVEGGVTVWREIALNGAESTHEDLRLRLALPASEHHTERRTKTVLQDGEALRIDDIASASVETLDTLADAHRLLSSLGTNSEFAEFIFVTQWSGLSETEKRDKYSKYACHELNLFIQRKDSGFFEAVVQPYLRNKKNKTFVDDYLTGATLSKYSEPWRYHRLNILERILLGQARSDMGMKTHIQDRFDLIAPDAASEMHLFMSALGTGALETSDKLGFGAAKMDLMEQSMGEEPEMLAAMSQMVGGSAGPRGSSRSRPSKKKSRSVAPSFDEMPSEISAEPIAAAFEMDMLEEECLDDDDFYGEDADGADLDAREQARAFFQQADKTEEFAENNYYRVRIGEQLAERIEVNAFWRDFAHHTPGTPFVSGNIAQATGNLSEMLCALAVLDLPFEVATDAKAEVQFSEGRMDLTAKQSMLVLHKEIKPAPLSDNAAAILVSQNYFRKDEQQEYVGSSYQDKYVTGEFLSQVVYLCQVVVTNPTSSVRELELLLQIPKGAMAVSDGFETKGQALRLGAFETEAFSYSFYFPAVGEFGHFPAHVSEKEVLVASASPKTITVVQQLSKVDATSWNYLSQHGDEDAVIAYLEAHNIERLDLTTIAWRMADLTFFERTLELLSQRHIYDHVLWSYAVKHNQRTHLQSFLLHQEFFLKGTGEVFGGIAPVDPVERHWYEHLEYLPLINARAHRLGAGTKILNQTFEAQYRRFLSTCCYRPQLEADQLAEATYYLLLQDRVQEGLAMLKRVDRSKVTPSLQWDYLCTYVAMYDAEALDEAKATAEKHKDHPVGRWRRLFTNALSQIAEAQGETSQGTDAPTKTDRQAQRAKEQGTFELSVEGTELKITHSNISECQVSYFPMDIELLFSRQPFVRQQSGRFSIITASRVDDISLQGEGEFTMALPEEFAHRNVVVEATAEGIRKSQVSFAHNMSLKIAENYGQLRVHNRNTQEASSRTYIKVFARMQDGQVSFYKDGYTDLRGAFDYASLSTDQLDRVQRFSILIMSDEDGALVREVAPPQQ